MVPSPVPGAPPSCGCGGFAHPQGQCWPICALPTSPSPCPWVLQGLRVLGRGLGAGGSAGCLLPAGGGRARRSPAAAWEPDAMMPPELLRSPGPPPPPPALAGTRCASTALPAPPAPARRARSRGGTWRSSTDRAGDTRQPLTPGHSPSGRWGQTQRAQEAAAPEGWGHASPRPAGAPPSPAHATRHKTATGHRRPRLPGRCPQPGRSPASGASGASGFRCLLSENDESVWEQHSPLFICVFLSKRTQNLLPPAPLLTPYAACATAARSAGSAGISSRPSNEAPSGAAALRPLAAWQSTAPTPGIPAPLGTGAVREPLPLPPSGSSSPPHSCSWRGPGSVLGRSSDSKGAGCRRARFGAH